MVKANSLFDGDVDAMEVVYHNLVPYEFVLADETENFFNVDVFELKTHIEISLNMLGRNYLFYRALNPVVDIAKYTTDY